MGPAYEALDVWMPDHGVEPNTDMWEVYFSDPVAEPDPSTWRTEIYAPTLSNSLRLTAARILATDAGPVSVR